MIDTSSVDIKAVADSFGSIRWRETRKVRGNTVVKGGPCPICGLGEDRFAIFPDEETPHFYCGINGTGCQAYGDVIELVRLVRGYETAGPAIRDIQEMGYSLGGTKCSSVRGFRDRSVPSTHVAPGEKWQAMGVSFVELCESVLWGPQGLAALEYLRSRGLKDETIRLARLGYNPTPKRQTAEKWDIEGHGRLWQGITIPWFIEGGLWRITIRDENATKADDGRYKQVKGGSNGLYLADVLGYRNRPVVVCEGEFDALSLLQECGHDVVPVATGTTCGSRTTKWIAALARCDNVYIAYDAEIGKGDDAAEWWVNTLGHAQRLRPWWGDINDMLLSGVDLYLWISPILPKPAYIDTLNFCSVCHSLADMFTEDGTPYCTACYESSLVTAPAPAPLAPAKKTLDEVAQYFRDELPQGWMISVMSRDEWDRRGYQRIAHNNPDKAVKLREISRESYKASVRAHLAKTNFYTQFEASNAKYWATVGGAHQ